MQGHKLALIQVDDGVRKVTAIEITQGDESITISDQYHPLPEKIAALANELIELVRKDNNNGNHQSN